MDPEDNSFKMLIRKLKPTSTDGFNRLNSSARLNFIKKIYKPLMVVTINTDSIYDGYTLACFLIQKFGAGTYDALKYDPSTHKLKARRKEIIKGRLVKIGESTQLFVIAITGDLTSRWGFEYIHSRGIARHHWWITDF